MDNDAFIKKIERNFNKNKTKYWINPSSKRSSNLLIYQLIKEILKDDPNIEIISLGVERDKRDEKNYIND